MKAIGLTEFGGPEVLKTVELPTPEPGPGEVRVRVTAVTVNPTDATFRSGGRASALADVARPYIPGVDFAGVVDALGEGTDGRLAIGAPVVGLVNPFGPRGGTYAQFIVLDERSVVAGPHRASAAESSTLLLNAVTAHLALDALGLEANQTVAVTGAAGAVGGYAIQLARARGLRVIADASPDDADLVSDLGANHIVLRGAGFTDRVRHLVPGGVAGLIDAANLREAVLSAIADGGVLATLRGWAGEPERGITIAPVAAFGSTTRTALFEDLVRLADEGILSLRVADVLPAGEAAEAHRRLEAGGVRGRLVLDLATFE